jgi:integrase
VPTISGEGYVNRIGHKRFYMFLVIDGQKMRRPTGTEDQDEAIEKLNEWKAQVKVGVVSGSQLLRYEDVRENYHKFGEEPQKLKSHYRDLDQFFKRVPVSAITPTKIKQFRAWRESKPEVLEYQQQTFEKELALRKLRAENGSGKKLSPARLKEIETAAREWVKNATKATTNRRLGILCAMFNRAAKEELISKSDVPVSFCLWPNADNVKTNKFTEEQFEAITNKMSLHLRPFLLFLYNTGMRRGQAKAMRWDMVDENNSLMIPGKYTKNGQPFPLPLADEDGTPWDWSKAIVETTNRPHGEPIFDTTNLNREWREVCHELGLGIYDKKANAYRGASLHDFRRTAASNMLATGQVSEGEAMQITGHKTSSMFKRYGIVDPKQTQRVFNVMRKKKIVSEGAR